MVFPLQTMQHSTTLFFQYNDHSPKILTKLKFQPKKISGTRLKWHYLFHKRQVPYKAAIIQNSFIHQISTKHLDKSPINWTLTHLSGDFSLASTLTNLCIILEKTDDFLSSVGVKSAVITWRGAFSGGVSVPLISREGTALQLVLLGLEAVARVSPAGLWRIPAPLSLVPAAVALAELGFSGEDFLRKERIDRCRCMAVRRRERSGGGQKLKSGHR